MSEDNKYSAPESELYEVSQPGEYGSVEKALTGDYQLAVGDVLSEAWAATNGSKWLINSAAATYFLIILVWAGITALLEYMLGGTAESPTLASSLVTLPLNLVFYGLSSVITTGLYIMGAKVSMKLPTSVGELFRFINKIVKATLTYLLMVILVGIGFLLLIVPGIYLLVAYFFAIPLALEKDLSPWHALETSRKAVTKKWFTVFGLMLVTGLLSAVAVLTLGIGFIWIVPLATIAWGIAYRNIFGLNPETLSS